MPELPEVEVCRRGLLPEVRGQAIEGVVLRAPKLRHELPASLAGTLLGRRIDNILRRGKYLLFDCRDGSGRGWLIVHLGMTGNFRFVPRGEPPGKHDHVDLVLPQIVLRYSDPRRFGTVVWHDGADPLEHPLLASLGVEPLSDDFTGAGLYTALQRRSGPIKPALMDSHLVVGVGNIYASESLFRAGVSPLRAANRVSRERVERLAEAIRETLAASIEAGGSSIRDYVHSDGSSGWFQISCGVYDRAGEPCRRCGGTVKQIRQAGRSTFYCPGCQR